MGNTDWNGNVLLSHLELFKNKIMPNNDFSKKKYQFVLLLLILLTGLVLFKQARPYLSGFLGAFTIYALLRGQMKFLHKKKN